MRLTMDILEKLKKLKKPLFNEDVAIEAELTVKSFSRFYSGLKNKEDKDKVIRAMILRSKLIYDLPIAYSDTKKEYQELLSQNESLFRRQDKEVLYGLGKLKQELDLQKKKVYTK